MMQWLDVPPGFKPLSKPTIPLNPKNDISTIKPTKPPKPEPLAPVSARVVDMGRDQAQDLPSILVVEEHTRRRPRHIPGALLDKSLNQAQNLPPTKHIAQDLPSDKPIRPLVDVKGLDRAQDLASNKLPKEPTRGKRGRPRKKNTVPVVVAEEPIRRSGRLRKQIYGPILDNKCEDSVKRKRRGKANPISRTSLGGGQDQELVEEIMLRSPSLHHSKASHAIGTRRQIGVEDRRTALSALLEKQKEKMPFCGKRPKETLQCHGSRDHHEQEDANSTTYQASRSVAPSMVNLVERFYDNDDEGDSEVNDGIVQVGSYRVKANMSHTLQHILHQHGDIAKDFQLESSTMLSSALENICNVVQMLKTTRFADVRQKKLDGFYSVVRDAEKLKLDVKWLREGLEKINQTLNTVYEYKEVKENKKKSMQRVESIKQALELKKAEMNDIKSAIQDLEGQLESETLKTEKLVSSMDALLSKWKSIHNTCLSNGIF